MYQAIKKHARHHYNDLIFIVLICFCLIQNAYFSEAEWVKNRFGISPSEIIESWIGTHAAPRFCDLIWWVSVINFSYLIIPVLFLKLNKQKLSSYGLNFKIEKKAFYYFILCFGLMFPATLLFSSQDDFLERYPFYKSPTGTINTNQILWELLYISQFFSLEFFFRGFMVHFLKNKIGIYSILFMTIPYCMIHFGKPYTETLGAIFAGLILGAFSYKSGSIWLGFFLHISVALTMDFAAMYRLGIL
jgi:membrane protease YdiL (CAAX protease family)